MIMAKIRNARWLLTHKWQHKLMYKFVDLVIERSYGDRGQTQAPTQKSKTILVMCVSYLVCCVYYLNSPHSQWCQWNTSRLLAEWLTGWEINKNRKRPKFQVTQLLDIPRPTIRPLLLLLLTHQSELFNRRLRLGHTHRIFKLKMAFWLIFNIYWCFPSLFVLLYIISWCYDPECILVPL